MHKKRILIIDDEASQRELLKILFAGKGYSVRCAATGSEGLKEDESFNAQVIILDIRLPDMDGLNVLQQLRKNNPKTNIIMITAYHDMETTVRAMKLGACEYITKPIDVDELEEAVSRTFRFVSADEPEQRSVEGDLLQKGPIIGRSKSMKEIFKIVGMFCENRVTVLIEGETGTGKELIARAIHYYSPNSPHPFLAINCSALVESLLESELFGHEKGAFTGAQYRRKGRFEMADGGTIFLDEIGTISQKMQVQLLRVIEAKQFTRVGGNDAISSDFRVICATNRDLEAAIAEGSFREDLYYRLNVFTIYVPPLRERRVDIPPLINHFVKKYAASMGKPVLDIDSEAMDLLIRNRWPGNVRELENVIERAMVLANPPAIKPADLPFQLQQSYQDNGVPDDSMTSMEKIHIAKVLDKMGWNITRTADALGIDRVTLYSKISKYGLKKP